MTDGGFLEIEDADPRSEHAPKGARDFPSAEPRHAGHFYALPQSPIVSSSADGRGVDRYFQIALCFRDEDLRANGQRSHPARLDDVVRRGPGGHDRDGPLVAALAKESPARRSRSRCRCSKPRRDGALTQRPARPSVTAELKELADLRPETDFKVVQQAPRERPADPRDLWRPAGGRSTAARNVDG